jgi:hypothetical protein
MHALDHYQVSAMFAMSLTEDLQGRDSSRPRSGKVEKCVGLDESSPYKR